jgi:hypothetical protein
MYTGWLLYQDALDASGYDDEFYWFWFNSKGVKFTDGKKKINGKHYAFDNYGAMLYEWVDTVTISDTTLGWFSAAEDGHLAKSQWIWTDNESLAGDDDNHWWYADKHGDLVTDCTKKINGKWYAFDANGKMAYGFVWLSKKSVKDSDAKIVGEPMDPADAKSDVHILGQYSETNCLHFFSNDEEKDGSMKTGSVKLELYDDDFTFGFDKNSGAALNGVEKNKLYDNGLLLTASDNRYEAVETAAGYFLVSSNGTRMKATTRTYKDADDVYWFVAGGNDDSGYDLYYGDTAADAKAKKKAWTGK